MFSTLRLRQRKSDKSKSKDEQKKNKQSKWSFDKAFCPGMVSSSTTNQNSSENHQLNQNFINNNTSDCYINENHQQNSQQNFHQNSSKFQDRYCDKRSSSPRPLRQSQSSPYEQKVEFNQVQFYQRYLQECPQCINENLNLSIKNDEDGVVSRVVGMSIQRDNTGLGINLMGGRLPDGSCSPVTVTFIKPNSPAYREGTLRVGDRLLAVNGRSLSGLTLHEVEVALSVPLVWLTVEYDVSLLTRLRSSGPLIVDIESPSKTNVGLSLIDSCGKVIVSNVKPASLAERCGALLPGDQILAVNDIRITSCYSADDVCNMLDNFTGQLLQIEIQPVPTISRERMCPSPSWSGSQRCLYDPGGGSSCSRRSASPFRSNSPFRSASRSNSPCIRSSSPICRSQSPSCHQISSSCHRSIPSTSERCHELIVERGVVTLHAPSSQDFGLKFRWVPSKMAAVISDLDANGVADRSGVLQIGDRITGVNGCRPGIELEPAPSVTLEVEFDVEVHQPVPPGTTIRVQLARSPSSGFGITINGSSDYGSNIVISRVRWGSVAHRSGRLAVGDHLLAIGDTRLDGDIHLATSVLKHCPNIVLFSILKNPNNIDLGYSSSGLPSVDSTVESWDYSPDNHAKSSEMGSSYSGLAGLEHDGSDRMTQSLHSIVTQPSAEDSSCVSSVVASPTRLKSACSKPPPSPPCPLQTNYKLRSNIGPKHWRQSSFVSNSTSDVFADLDALEAELKSVAGIKDNGATFLTFRGDSQPKISNNLVENQSKVSSDAQRIKISLYKDPIYEDFGFSVSDGLYERGVFINRIRPGGPADLSRLLKPFDRIVQVNDTKTDDFDCCLTVPLVATSSDPLVLVVERSNKHQNINNNTTPFNSTMNNEDNSNWMDSGAETKIENNYQTL